MAPKQNGVAHQPASDTISKRPAEKAVTGSVQATKQDSQSTKSTKLIAYDQEVSHFVIRTMRYSIFHC